MSRAAILFAGAAVGIACGGSTVTGETGDASPGNDGEADVAVDAAKDGNPVAMYGPAPVDSGVRDTAADEGTDADSGGVLVMYGPAPVDSGNG
jgi:hypothetical protein